MKDICDSLLCRFTLIFFLVNKIIDQKSCLLFFSRGNHMNVLLQAFLQEVKIFSYPLGLEIWICSSMWWMFTTPPMMTDVYQGHSFTVFLGSGNSWSPYVSPIKKHSVFIESDNYLLQFCFYWQKVIFKQYYLTPQFW